MKFLLFTVCFVAGVAHAQQKAAPKAGQSPSPVSLANSTNFRLDLRGGLLLERLDTEATGAWSHNSTGSYGGYLGLYYVFPPSWRELKFFAGPELGYFSSQETIGNSQLSTKMFTTMAVGGLVYRPLFLGGDWGVEFKSGGQLYASKQSTLNSPGFSRAIGNSSVPAFSMILTSLGLVYAADAQWVLRVSFDSLKLLSFGVSYDF